METRRKFHILLLGTVTVLAMLLLNACGAAQEPTPTPTTPRAAVATPQPTPTAAPAKTGEPKYGGVAVFSNRADPVGAWDLMRSSTITNTVVGLPIWGMGNLVRTCRDNPYLQCPGLAEKWDVNPDFTQWTFKLRDNLSWHDGTPLTTEDVKWWIDLAAKGASGRRAATFAPDAFGPFDKVETLPGNQLRITLKSPVVQYLVGLGRPQHVLTHPRHLAQPEIDKGNINVTPQDIGLVGVGPFKFKEYVKGSFVSVRRFDKYWEKDDKGRQLPYLDGIDFPIISDPAAMVAAVRTGRLDTGGRGAGQDVLAEQMQVLKREMGDKIAFLVDNANYVHLDFNTIRKGPWQDLRVRKAVSLSFDRQGGVTAFYGGVGGVRSLFPPDSPWGNSDFTKWPGYNPDTRTQDRAEAKRLLGDAGYPTGFDTTFLCRSGDWVPYCEYMVEQLRILGIKAPMTILDSATYTDRLNAGNWDIAIAGGGDAAGFPETAPSLVASNAAYPTTWLHNDSKVDEFFDRLRKAPTLEQRVAVARELERYVMLDKVYMVIGWVQARSYPYRTHLKGLVPPGPTASNYLDNAWVWLDK